MPLKEKILAKLDFRAFYEQELGDLDKQNKEGRVMALCPFHDDHEPSLSVNLNTGRFMCFGCNSSGSVFDFYMKRHGVDFPTALARLAEIARVRALVDNDNRAKKQSYFDQESIERIMHPDLGKPDAIYPYADPEGNIVFAVCRWEANGARKKKTFRQCRPNGRDVPVWSMDGVQRFPYRAQEIAGADAVFIVEGEKCVHALVDLGLVATCNPGGAGKWTDELNPHFRGKNVVILPDNHGVGHDHGYRVAQSLYDVAESIKVVKFSGLPEKGDVVDWLEAGHTKTELLELMNDVPEWKPEQQTETDGDEDADLGYDEWNRARQLFPKTPFPWDVLPDCIADSLKQLARSHATSPQSLPGTAIAIFSSLLGGTISISPKESWREPLIFWFVDIRPSGEGKTPPVAALCGVLYAAQNKVDKDERKRRNEEQAKKTENRHPVPRARGYFITELTLEGLRSDISGHGGMICVYNELSSFISGQNQYKSKGNDREAWLTLHDGKPTRIVRANEAFTIENARVNITGGIQPGVWKTVFRGKGGIYIVDGTVYRFLPTFEGDQHYHLTSESWEDRNRQIWEKTLNLAMDWADQRSGAENTQPLILPLDMEAQRLFIGWRNSLMSEKGALPDQFRGYLPKIVGYALRLTGALHCMRRFATGNYPAEVLTREDVEKGIRAASFYMGHAVDAMQALCTDNAVVPVDADPRVKHLAKTLESLRGEVDSGRLAVGHIQKRFNEDRKPEQRISARAMGALIRSCGLTIPATRYRANGKAGAYCLVWDEKTNSFLKQVHDLQQVHESPNHRGSDPENIEMKRSTSSTKGSDAVNVLNIDDPKFTASNPHQPGTREHVEHCERPFEKSEEWETGTI